MQQIVKAVIVLLTSLFIGHLTIAQEITVVSDFDHSALPYATVMNHTQRTIVSTDMKGIVRLNATIGDTLSFSYVGYKTSVLYFDGETSLVISLLQQRKTLPEVTVYHCKSNHEYVHSNFVDIGTKKRRAIEKNTFAGVLWGKGTNINAMIAVRLQPLKEFAVLKDFSFWIERPWGAPKSSVLAPLLISLYAVADNDNLPGEAISEKPIIYYPKGAGKQTIRFDTLSVHLPPQGVYLSLQYVTNEASEWSHKTKWRNSEKDSISRDTILIKYGGLIVGERSKGFELASYHGIRGSWTFLPPPTGSDLPATIRCSATVQYCGK